MNGKKYIKHVTETAALLLAFIIVCHGSSAQQVFDNVEKGPYSLQRTAMPELLITGVNLNRLSKTHFSSMDKINESQIAMFGRTRTLFDKESKKQIKISVAVYGNVKEAEDAVIELLNTISAVMKPGSVSGGVIGTHSWYLKSPNGSGTVIFVYNNSLFQLFSSDFDLADRKAKSIVDDLSKGINGVRLGRRVKLPIINDAILSEKPLRNKETFIIMKASDPSGQDLTFTVSASNGQLYDTDKRDKRTFVPGESGESEIKVYAVNEENVVSRVFIKKLDIIDKK